MLCSTRIWFAVVIALTFCGYVLGCDLTPQQPDATVGDDAGSLWSYEDVLEEDISNDSSLGSPVADELVAAVAGCKKMSPNTVPGGWQPVIATTGGCTVWIPAHWILFGIVDEYLFASDQAQTAAAFVLAGNLDGLGWTLAGIADYILDELAVQAGAGEHVNLYFEQFVDQGLPTAEVLYTFVAGEKETAGYARIVLYGCTARTNTCNVSLVGFWMPADDIPAYACTGAQIAASLQCPTAY